MITNDSVSRKNVICKTRETDNYIYYHTFNNRIKTKIVAYIIKDKIKEYIEENIHVLIDY